jgi:hypothetical protein
MKQATDTTFIHGWLVETEGGPPDTVEGTQQVMSQIEETPQAGRWLPFPLFHRKAKVKTPTTKYQPTPISALNGHTPTVLGRTQSMFSPVKAITAGALVFAIGGAFLIAQPFGQQESTVPAAETEAVPATWVTGTIALGASCSGPTASTPSASTSEADVQPEREHHRCSTQTWTTSDPRLTGTSTSTWDADVYVLDEAIISVVAGTYELQNESGGWLCHYRDDLANGMGRYAVLATDQTVTCVGDDAYDGLTAILSLDWSNSPPSDVPLAGLIFPGEAPPLPELPAAE